MCIYSATVVLGSIIYGGRGERTVNYPEVQFAVLSNDAKLEYVIASKDVICGPQMFSHTGCSMQKL